MRASLLTAMAGLFAVVFSLNAQTTTGSIVGTITDPSASVVAGATVTITNTATGISTKTTTANDGAYVLTPVAVGVYTVSVQAAGFKTSVSQNITVNVQDRVRVDASLQVGELSETVQVEAAAPLLQTDTSYLGQVVNSQEIVDLPLNGRYFTRLAVLTAGTAPTPNGARDEKTGGFSANGGVEPVWRGSGYCFVAPQDCYLAGRAVVDGGCSGQR